MGNKVEQWSWESVKTGRLVECDAVVQATGWEPTVLPRLCIHGQDRLWSVGELSRDPVSYQLKLNGELLPLMFGTGIAFPEEPGKIEASPSERGIGFPFAASAVDSCQATLKNEAL